MSKFYTEIANYYDDIFPVGKLQLSFLTESLGQPPKQVLDVACGSGGYSIHLSQLGFDVVAVDLNQEMIENLKKKDPTIDAKVLDMLQIDSLNETFDCIYCIGNSLVHLESLEEMKQFLINCKSKLKENGQLILQIVNYDRILDQSVNSLPTITNDNAHLIFERNYMYLPKQHTIDFHTKLIVDNQVIENHQFLYPLRFHEIQLLLTNVGFKQIKIYGSFKKDAYDPKTSFAMVLLIS